MQRRERPRRRSEHHHMTACMSQSKHHLRAALLPCGKRTFVRQHERDWRAMGAEAAWQEGGRGRPSDAIILAGASATYTNGTCLLQGDLDVFDKYVHVARLAHYVD